ncbi:oxalate:formate antiporter [Acidovorax cavernicola]|uniref:Oxalate:formate antiporter n=2 Tax=Acidovorax cavernicola TaxID=1675792 RepID=A0A9X8D082_9BURK|nr:oxalate:formate antiporter [Acidovorax cavernicola]
MIGIAATGSYAENAMDTFSDVDLILTCNKEDHAGLMRDRASLAALLGPLVAAFTGEHVGEPRVLICLYGPPALHLDLKVVALPDLADRVDEPVVLWERDGRMTAAFAAGVGRHPAPDPQWIEDRFWVWVHYAALKIARGELQESLDFLSYLRVTVLGPLGLMRYGLKPTGVRRVEANPALAQQLASTAGAVDRAALLAALRNACAAYHAFRPSSVKANEKAEQVAMDYVAEVAASL